MRLCKQAVRQLFRSPGFLTVAALALGLGIGSTTTIFSIVRAVFVRGLPYADPESLVQLRSSVPEQQIVGAGFSYPRYEAVRDRQTVFSATSCSAFAAFTLTANGGEPEQVQGLQTAYDYLPLLGLAPEVGRGFTADEDRPGGPDVVLLNDPSRPPRSLSPSLQAGTTSTSRGADRLIVYLPVFEENRLWRRALRGERPRIEDRA